MMRQILGRSWREELRTGTVSSGSQDRLFRLLQHRLALHQLTAAPEGVNRLQKHSRRALHDQDVSPACGLAEREAQQKAGKTRKVLGAALRRHLEGNS